MSTARQRVARGAVLAALGLAEYVVAVGYYNRGTSWHWLLHTAIGIGLGLATGALVAAGRGRPTRPLPWALAGQAVSIAPDILFFAFRLAHQRWMDVFVGHVSVHSAPQPLLLALAVFLLGGWSWWLSGAAGRRAAGAVVALTAIGILGTGLALHRPIPAQLSGYGPANGAGELPAGWWCGDTAAPR